MRRTYGWIRDAHDHRDYLYKLSRPKTGIIKPVIDLRPLCSAVEDQGTLGACTANALAGNVELLDKMADGKYTDVSRLFIYYNERALEGTINEDAGAMIRDGIKTLAADGVCSEDKCPYTTRDFAQKPSDAAYADAKNHRITSYMRITSLNEMLVCLSDGFPFVFGIQIFESFETDKVAKRGIIPMPGAREECLGGHAVMAVGHSVREKSFIVRNSWGAEWGMKGYFKIPFAYLEEYGDDFWTIRK